MQSTKEMAYQSHPRQDYHRVQDMGAGRVGLERSNAMRIDPNVLPVLV